MPWRSSRLARLPSTSTFECPEERSINLCKTQGTDLVLVQRDKPTFSEYKTGSLTSIIRSWKAWTSFSRRSASSCSYLPQKRRRRSGEFFGVQGRPWGEHACERRHPLSLHAQDIMRPCTIDCCSLYFMLRWHAQEGGTGRHNTARSPRPQ